MDEINAVNRFEFEKQAAQSVGLTLQAEDEVFAIGLRTVPAVQWEFRLTYRSLDEISAFIEGYIRARRERQ